MQDFGQPPGGPLQNPLDGPFEDPFEAMSNDFGPGANFDLFNPFDYTEAQLEELFMDDLGRILNQLEDGIEHSQPIPPEQQTPQVPDTLIGPLGASPDVFSAAEQNNEEISSEQTTADMPPSPYFIEESQSISPHKPPRPPVGRIGRRGGASIRSSCTEQSDEKYCPIEDDYVSQDFCEDKDCNYYVKDSDSETVWHCTYHDDEESK